jgi:hypothetical protein
MGRKVVASVGGFLVGLVALATLQYVAGVGLPTGAPLAVAVIAAVALFVAPDIDVRKEAEAAGRVHRAAVHLPGPGVAEDGRSRGRHAAALPEAAQRGRLADDAHPRHLVRARLSGQDEWDALGQLGERIAVPDLRELGALVKLVADDGAQVRTTLTARAASMRRARLADEEGNAEERNQSMRLAHMLIAVGFMVFVGYPAFVNIKF